MIELLAGVAIGVAVTTWVGYYVAVRPLDKVILFMRREGYVARIEREQPPVREHVQFPHEGL